MLGSTFFLGNLICHELELHIHPNNWLTRCLWNRRLISGCFQRSAICSSRWLLTFITYSLTDAFCTRGGKLFCNGPDSKCFQLCLLCGNYSNSAIDSMWQWSCVPVKLYLQNKYSRPIVCWSLSLVYIVRIIPQKEPSKAFFPSPPWPYTIRIACGLQLAIAFFFPILFWAGEYCTFTGMPVSLSIISLPTIVLCIIH